MLRHIFILSLLFSFFGLTGCSYTDQEEKYELKSPCVAAEVLQHTSPSPCVRRPLGS